MIFVGRVTYWFDDEEYKDACFVTGESFKEATSYLIEYFGEDLIDSIEVELFGPDNILSFDITNAEEKEIFEKAYEVLKFKQNW